MLARLKPEAPRRKGASRKPAAAPKPQPRPRVKTARIIPAPRPEEAQALTRLASAAAAMPVAPTVRDRKTPEQATTTPPLPKARPHRKPGIAAKVRVNGDSGDVDSAKRPNAPTRTDRTENHPATHPDMLATSVMVRVLEEEALDDHVSNPAPKPGVPSTDTAAVREHSPQKGEARKDASVTAGASSPRHASPALRTNSHTSQEGDTLVITKTSAPPPEPANVQEPGEDRARSATLKHDRNDNTASMHIIADDPQQVRKLIASHWLIQVVATPSLDAAQKYLLKVRKASAQVRGRPAFVVRFTNGGKTLYRARFTGFSRQQEADRACKDLQRKGISCMVLAPVRG